MNSRAELRGCADAHLARYLDPDHPLHRAFAAYDAAGDTATDHVTALARAVARPSVTVSARTSGPAERRGPGWLRKAVGADPLAVPQLSPI